MKYVQFIDKRCGFNLFLVNTYIFVHMVYVKIYKPFNIIVLYFPLFFIMVTIIGNFRHLGK